MNEERMPPEDSREPVLTPQPPQGEMLPEPSVWGWKLALVLFVMLAGLAVCYGWLQHDAAQQLATEREDLRTSLAQAKSQEDALSVKVNALTAAQAQEQAARLQAEATPPADTVKDEQLLSPTSEAPRRRTHAAVARRRVPVDDPRWKQFQQQLGDQQSALAEHQKELEKNKQQIAETQANLDSTKTELNSNLQIGADRVGQRHCPQPFRGGGLTEKGRAHLLRVQL